MKETEHSGSAFLLNESTLPIIEKIAEGIPGGFFIYHADGNEEIIYVNKAMLRIFGCETEEEFKALTGNSFKGIVHPDDINEVENSISRQIEANSTNLDYVEYRIIQKDGTIRWIEDYGHFMHTEEYGDIFYVFIDDATDRLAKRLANLEEINQELRKAYAQGVQYQRAILHDAVMFFEIDLTRDEFISSGAQLLKKNIAGLFDFEDVPRFKKYSEYIKYWAKHTKEETRGQYWEFFDLDRLKACYEKGELEQVYDTWATDAYGSERLLRYTFLLGRSEVTGDIIALSVAKDITDTMEHRRLLETAWKQAEIANIARNTFLNNLSHDIKTPLNGILGYTDLMVRHIDDKDTLLEYIGKIRSFNEQLNAIWEQSLEITNIESGKVMLKEEKCDLRDILYEVEQRCQLKAAAKNITFLYDDKAIDHHLIIADRTHLREILWQILDNAVKYTQENGEVMFSALELNDSQNGYARYQFVVKDNGRGMHKEFLGKLFMPFEREKNSTQGGVFGIGLGLSVAKNLADLMGGSIDAESEPDKGSVFTVHLMFRLQNKEAATHRPFEEKVDLSGKRILLVEDNEINREMTEELLTDLGFVVDVAVDGADALRKVQLTKPYDIILMDIQMPIMDGYESAKAIRKLADPALANVPIIALSADMFSSSQEKALESGMNAHCSKPINIESLCDVIYTILNCCL